MPGRRDVRNFDFFAVGRRIGSLAWSLLALNFCMAQNDIMPHVTSASGEFSTTLFFKNTTGMAQPFTLLPFNESGQALAAISDQVPAGETLGITARELFGSDHHVSHFEMNPSENITMTTSYRVREGPGSSAHFNASSAMSQVWEFFPGEWSQVFDAFAAVNGGTGACDVFIEQISFKGELVHKETVILGLQPNVKLLSVLGGSGGSLFEERQDVFYRVVATQPVWFLALRGNLQSTLLWGNDAIAGVQGDVCGIRGYELFGSWSSRFDTLSEWLGGGNSCETSDLIFSNDCTLSIYDTEGCTSIIYEFTGKATWRVEDHFIYSTNTEVSDPDDEIGVESKGYYFITSTGLLGIQDDETIFSRIGSGSGIVGRWMQDGEDCVLTVDINADSTWSSDAGCDKPLAGTYTTNDDRITLNAGTLSINAFFKFLDSKLALVQVDRLYSRTFPALDVANWQFR